MDIKNILNTPSMKKHFVQKLCQNFLTPWTTSHHSFTNKTQASRAQKEPQASKAKSFDKDRANSVETIQTNQVLSKDKGNKKKIRQSQSKRLMLSALVPPRSIKDHDEGFQ